MHDFDVITGPTPGRSAVPTAAAFAVKPSPHDAASLAADGSTAAPPAPQRTRDAQGAVLLASAPPALPD